MKVQAFTVGSDIYIGQGYYSPTTTRGRNLLAHELTHTIQQGGGARIQRQELDGDRQPGLPLPYREASEMHTCMQIHQDLAHCRREILGEEERQGPVAAPTVPLTPIEQARADVILALTAATDRLAQAIADRDAGRPTSQDVTEALCYFPGYQALSLDGIHARVSSMAAWIPSIIVRSPPDPIPAGHRDAALLRFAKNNLGLPAVTIVRRELPAMAPGPDYIAVFPSWWNSPTLRATRLLHEAFHYSWVGMTHNGSWNNAFAWQGLVSWLGGLTTGATLRARYPRCRAHP